MKMHITVMTSDRYLDALKPFLYLYDKYWRPVSTYGAPDITIFGFTIPDWASRLPPNIQFESLGKFEDYPFGKWSDALMLALDRLIGRSINHSIIMLEDYWIVHPVNVVAVDHAWRYMLAHKNVIKFDLCADRRYAMDADINYGQYGVLDLVKSMNYSPYHLSLLTGIWNLKHLKTVLRPNWSPHDVEMTGTAVLGERDDLVVVGSHQWPVYHTLALRGGDSAKLLLGELKPKDLEEIRALGLLKKWEK